MHECKMSFRRWLLKPILDVIEKPKSPDPATAQATADLKANTKLMDQSTGELKAAIPPDPSKSS